MTTAFKTDPPPARSLPRGSTFRVLEMPETRCARCGIAIRSPRNCRVIIYQDIAGNALDAGLLCPNC